MERVSFKVAKAIIEAGYPQIISSVSSSAWYLPNEQLYTSYIDATIPLREFYEMKAVCIAPTYLDVWLWLWREKKITVYTEECLGKWGVFELDSNISREGYIYSDPEEAIIAAIDYFVDNNLLK